MANYCYHLLLFSLLSFSLGCDSWGWFSSSSFSEEQTFPNKGSTTIGSVADFSMEGFIDSKGVKLVENAKNKMIDSNSCWQHAYRHLFSGCSEILADNDKRSRLAWHLSDCFQRDSGRTPFENCDPKSTMAKCLRNLDDLAHKVYLEFYLETNSICHQLQAYAFKHETERLVTELKSSAQYVEDKLDSMDEKSERLLRSSNRIHDSLSSIDVHTQQVAHTAKSLENHVDIVLRHSENVYEQTKKISESQLQLKEGQEGMKRNLEDGVALIKDSYNYLGLEIEKLRNDAIEIEKEVIKLGDTMSTKITSLHTKAEDIGNMAGKSLHKQQLLLDGQSMALESLNSLSEFQSKAMEESRKSLEHFAEYGNKQHEELVQRQKQFQGLHDRLMENSKTILAAQESFESKQASMFLALDKLFALQNAVLLESRAIKAFFVYSISIFVIYMLTSTKQTYNVRPRLYIGLCGMFFIEVSILRFVNDNIEQQTWIVSMVRSFFMAVAAIQLLYAIFTYRDYEKLNHELLLTLVEKVNDMQMQKELLEEDSDINWLQWINTDLSDDGDCLDDPSYTIIPEQIGEISDHSITSSSDMRYNLRPRSCIHC
ncbi:hypothetical protein PIB30_047172 [Stylosanthes scabra]|uniref:Protein GAMETE EXPRESSED 1 n=1 Tax=Stylosanthes scabra TaxID=79078 RepID=A0ABU6YH63_9FABA|nr:hypothetical protein [Stylosanthes scabra]